MNRREVFASLAGLPLIGFLFGITNGKDENKPSFARSNLRPELHIPQENGFVKCIPLSERFQVSEIFETKDGLQEFSTVRMDSLGLHQVKKNDSGWEFIKDTNTFTWGS